MVLLDRLMDIFCGHAAVVNKDEVALKMEVRMLQKKYGLWMKVRGFVDFHQLFLALHLAKAKRRPFTAAFIRDSEPIEGRIILKRTLPSVKIFDYKDTKNLMEHLPLLR